MVIFLKVRCLNLSRKLNRSLRVAPGEGLQF